MSTPAPDSRPRTGCCHDQADDEHTIVQVETEFQRHVGGDLEGLQHRDDARPDQQTECAATHGDEQALDEELSHEAQAPGANRQPQGDFTAAHRGTAREQPRDVRAGR